MIVGRIRGKSRNILLVEDDEITRTIFSRHLTRLGHEVTAVSDGLEALDILGRKRPDLIVTDLNMPVMDGFEMIQTIRFKEEYYDIPIIAMTSSPDPEDRERAIKLGCDCFLPKAVILERLNLAIEELTGKKTA